MNAWQATARDRNGRHLDEDDALEANLLERIIRAVDDASAHTMDKAQVRVLVDQATRRVLAEEYPQVVGDEKEELIGRLLDEVTGLGPIESLVRDPSISEIMVNAPDEVYFERDGIIQESDTKFKDRAHIMRVIERITTALGRHVDEASPMVDARLDDGSRVNVIIPPLVPHSPVLTIRKFRSDLFSMSELAQVGTLSNATAELLGACVRARLNIVISGGTGTGKTTLLNALSAYIPERERIVTIEDPLEIRLQQKHVIPMEARPPSTEGAGEVTQRMLLRNALRMRPDRIIIGEVRGAEAFDMMQAMNTGHDGSMTTVHANSPRDALARVENMVLMAGFDLPLVAIREQMGSALHILIHITRAFDGVRRVTNICEISGMEGNVITMQDIFTFRQTGIDEGGKISGQLEPTGIRPHFADKLKALGIELPDGTFGVERWL